MILSPCAQAPITQPVRPSSSLASPLHFEPPWPPSLARPTQDATQGAGLTSGQPHLATPPVHHLAHPCPALPHEVLQVHPGLWGRACWALPTGVVPAPDEEHVTLPMQGPQRCWDWGWGSQV